MGSSVGASALVLRLLAGVLRLGLRLPRQLLVKLLLKLLCFIQGTHSQAAKVVEVSEGARGGREGVE